MADKTLTRYLNEAQAMGAMILGIRSTWDGTGSVDARLARHGELKNLDRLDRNDVVRIFDEIRAATTIEEKSGSSAFVGVLRVDSHQAAIAVSTANGGHPQVTMHLGLSSISEVDENNREMSRLIDALHDRWSAEERFSPTADRAEELLRASLDAMRRVENVDLDEFFAATDIELPPAPPYDFEHDRDVLEEARRRGSPSIFGVDALVLDDVVLERCKRAMDDSSDPAAKSILEGKMRKIEARIADRGAAKLEQARREAAQEAFDDSALRDALTVLASACRDVHFKNDAETLDRLFGAVRGVQIEFPRGDAPPPERLDEVIVAKLEMFAGAPEMTIARIVVSVLLDEAQQVQRRAFETTHQSAADAACDIVAQAYADVKRGIFQR